MGHSKRFSSRDKKDSRNDQRRIFLVFFLVNTASLLILNHFVKPFGYEYEEIARNLLNGYGYSGKFIHGAAREPSSFMAPLYPFLLFLNFKLFGPSNFLPLQILQSFTLSVVPAICYSLSRRLFQSRRVALLAVLLLLIDYPFTMFSGYIGVPAFLTLGTVVVIFLFLRMEERPSFVKFALIGLLAGIFLLLDPIFLMTFASGLLWVIFFRRSRRNIFYAVFSVLVAFLVISPWLYRNYRLFGRFPVLKSSFGFNLLEGNNPMATGGLYTKEGLQLTDEIWKIIPDSTREKLTSLNEVERSLLCQSIALRFIKKKIREDPLGFLGLKLNAFLYFWVGQTWNMRYENVLMRRGIDPKKVIFFRLTLISSLFLLLPALLGMISLKKPRAEVWLPIILFLLYPVPYIVTKGHSFLRFRIVLDPLLVSYSAYFFSRILWRGKMSDEERDLTTRGQSH